MVNKMIKPKKEFVCNECEFKYPKWSGTCYRGCGKTNTLTEKVLATATPKRSRASKSAGNLSRKEPLSPSANAKKLIRRSKQSERDIARRMVNADGPDPAFRNIASSTGRIGFITGIRVDAISRSYVTENKNRKMPTWLIAAWILINQRAVDFEKNALLHVDPPNMPRDFPLNGETRPLDTMAIITQSRHEELIHNEKILQELVQAMENDELYQPLLEAYWAAHTRNKG
jgi:hypothetical protein